MPTFLRYLNLARISISVYSMVLIMLTKIFREHAHIYNKIDIYNVILPKKITFS